ncbi:MAG: hypothetical protein EOP05_09855 [Proteobacteria bacterium]|nr:MAG: hypothetical protein EOP05_09855 [Pseudomonadota bacterium]
MNDYALDVRREVEAKYKSVVSLKARSGFKRGRFLFGGTGEFHASRGADFRSETANFSSPGTRLIVAGPELGATFGKVRMKAYAKTILTGTGDLDALADIMDRGAGNGAYGASLDYTF